MTWRRQVFGVLSLAVLGMLVLGDGPPAGPTSPGRTSDAPPPAGISLRHDEVRECSEPAAPPQSRVVPEVLAGFEPAIESERGESPPSRSGPVPRRRVPARELNAVKRPVEGCVRRHAGNLVTELSVRVLVSAEGVARRVTLPATSSPGLVECVTGAVQSRRYSPGAASETLRHVFRFRQE